MLWTRLISSLNALTRNPRDLPQRQKGSQTLYKYLSLSSCLSHSHRSSTVEFWVAFNEIHPRCSSTRTGNPSESPRTRAPFYPLPHALFLTTPMGNIDPTGRTRIETDCNVLTDFNRDFCFA